MLFMVIENFKPEMQQQMANRFRTSGRMLPEGVEYQVSWMAADGSSCYQVMGAPTREALNVWIGRWNDLVDFDVIEVKTSQEYWTEKA
jgi:hypothetical protein